MSAEVISRRIAQRLKALRAERGWSLDVCSQHTKVSKAMLGQIEREESNPTIAVLWKIATGFQVSFSSFLAVEEAQATNEARSFSSADRKATISDHQGMQVETLFPFAPDLRMETLRVTLSPNHTQQSVAHNKGVIEHIIVLEGTLIMGLENQAITLTTGQTLRFNADQTHSYGNGCEGGDTVFHNIICYPAF